MRIARSRLRSRLWSAAIAVPPGDVTWSLRIAGWTFRTSAILAAPRTVWTVSAVATSRERPTRTPASESPSMI